MKKLRLSIELYKVTWDGHTFYWCSEHPDICQKYEDIHEMREMPFFDGMISFLVPTLETTRQRLIDKFPGYAHEYVETV